MALGTATITVPVNAVNKVLKRINQDEHSSEYHLKEATQSFTLLIRHSKSKATPSKPSVDFHNMELVQRVFPTPTAPEIVRRSFITVAMDYFDSNSEVGYLSKALTDTLNAAGNTDDFLSWVN